MRDAFLSDDQGHTYLNIVMDFIQGGTLIQYVNAHRPVSEETTRLATPVAGKAGDKQQHTRGPLCVALLAVHESLPPA